MVLFLIDSQEFLNEEVAIQSQLTQLKEKYPDKPLWIVFNKIDLIQSTLPKDVLDYPTLGISAKTGKGINALKEVLVNYLLNKNYQDQSILSNSRHFSALNAALTEISKVQKGLENELSGDLLAIDLRQALYHLGEITGEVTNDELLGNIFANFCIGK